MNLGSKITGVALIAYERTEQIDKHHRTTMEDLINNDRNQLVRGAISLASDPSLHLRDSEHILYNKPDGWNDVIWVGMCRKPYKERLITAGALIAAKIDTIIYEENEKAELNQTTEI